MATRPHTPDFEDLPGRDDLVGDDALTDAPRRAADDIDLLPDQPAGDSTPVLDDAAGSDDEDVAVEASAPTRRRGR